MEPTQHFWLLHGVLWLAITRFLPPDVSRIGGEPELFRTLFARLGVSLLAISLVLWVLQQLAAPLPSPLINTWPAPWRSCAFGAVTLYVMAIFLWIQLGSGAQRVARAAGTTARKTRAYAALALVVIVLVNLLPFATSIAQSGGQ